MEVVIFIQKCPKKEVEVEYFIYNIGKNLEIPIKTAIFRLKNSYPEGLGGRWLKVIKKSLLPKLLTEQSSSLPNLALTREESETCKTVLKIRIYSIDCLATYEA